MILQNLDCVVKMEGIFNNAVLWVLMQKKTMIFAILIVKLQVPS